MKGKIEDYILVAAFFFVLVSISLSIHGLTREVCKFRLAVEELATIEDAKFQYVTLTAYTGNTTATMKKPRSGWTVAVSDSLFEKGWLGRKIYIDGHGVFEAQCRTASTVKGNVIDIHAPNKKYAMNFGIRQNVKAVVLD